MLRGRAERRREGARAIVGRLRAALGRPTPESSEEAVAVLHTLTSFETFDTLAGQRGPLEVLPVVRRIIRAALGVEDKGLESRL